jgi:hypothetical protein
MKTFSATCAICFLTVASGWAASPYFSPGNLTVVRCGDGTQTLVSSGNTIFIDQYATNGALVSTTNIPDTGTNALILSGVASSEGGLTLSIDRTTLAFTGYSANRGSVTGASLSSTTSANVPRVIATLDAFGNYTIGQSTTSLFSGQNPRYAATDGTNDFWVVGGASGVVYFNPPADPIQINTSIANNRALKIAGGNIYFSTQKGAPIGLYTFTSTPGGYTPAGLPTTASVGTNLLFATGSASAPEGFALNPAVTVAYVADSGGNGTGTQGGGIQKWIFDGLTWSWAYTFALAVAPQPPGAFAVTVDFSGPNPIIYATTVETNSVSAGDVAGNHLVRIVDTNSTAEVEYLAQAGTNEVFRGVDFAPNLLPQILAQPQSIIVTNRTPGVTLAVSATSPFSVSYQWQHNGSNVVDSANISGANSPDLTFESAQLSDQGNYSVISSNQYGAVTSSIAVLTVNTVAVPPVITAQPQGQVSFVSGTVTFNISASGTDPLSYQWSQVVGGITNALKDGLGASGEVFNGSASASLIIANAQTNDAGTYFVTVSNSAGMTNSQGANFIVNQPPPPSMIPLFVPGNLAVLRCGDGVETLAHYGNTIFIDQYQTNGSFVSTTNLPDNGATALILSGIASSEGGLTLSEDGTELAFTGYNTNLNALDTSALSSTDSGSVPREIGTMDMFGNYTQVQITTSLFSGDNPRYAATDGRNHFWAVGGNSGLVYFNPPSDPLQINVSVNNSRAVKINDGNLYFSTQNGSPVGIYTFTPTGLPMDFNNTTNLLFATGDDSSPEGFALNPSATITYVADSGGYVGDTEGGGIQKWIFNGSTWNWAYTIPLASGLQPPGAFAVTADFSGPSPIIYATTVETNSSSGGNIAGNHLVRIVDTNSTAAVVYLAQAAPNEVFKGIEFTPTYLPQIVQQPQSQTVTSGTSVNIAVNAASPFALSYQWLKNGSNIVNGGNISGATTATLNFQSAQASNQGGYSVIVSNLYGAVTSAVATLTVNATAMRPVITTEPKSQTNLIGSTVNFTVVATGTPTPAYQWVEIIGGVTNTLSDGLGASGETFSGSMNATLSILNIQTNDVGSYFVMVSNSIGATNSQPAMLAVTPVPPQIVAQPSPLTILVGQSANFTAIASGTSPTYQWTFNGARLSDGLGSSGEMFQGTATANLEIDNAQTSDTGNYAVTATNSAGLAQSQSVLLTVVALPPPSSISYSTAGSTYSQNFDSLPSLGTNFTATVKTENPVTINGITYSFGDADPFDFAAPSLPDAGLPGGLGLATTMPGWYGWTQDSDFNRFGASAGDQGRGGIISFGSTNSYTESTNRALGLLTTGSKHDGGTMAAAVAARFINNTPLTLNSINVQFIGELWRQSDLPKTLSFSYLVDPTGTNSFDTNAMDYTGVTNLDVSFLTDPDAEGGVAVDGTSPENQVTNSVVNQSITDWPKGAALWLVWEFTDPTSKAQGIGIDNLSFSAVAGLTAPLLENVTFNRTNGTGLSFSFTDEPAASASFTIHSTTNLTLPFSQWQNLGHPVESTPGNYEFHDAQATNLVQRFYRVTSP